MRRYYALFIGLFLTTFFLTNEIKAQEESSSAFSLNAGTDIVSNYIWRGAPSVSYIPGGTSGLLAPSIQPVLSVSAFGITIGAWGSTDFTGSYLETDLFASYTFKNITATVTDYYWAYGAAGSFGDYFEYGKDSTGHILEGSLMFKGGESLPLTITVATMFYGADKKVDGTEVKNNLSTYIEAAYNIPVGSSSLDVFLGVSPTDGYYGDGYKLLGGDKEGGVVNMGFTGYRKIKISDSFELPIKASLIMNPQAKKTFFVVGITL